MKNLIRTVLVVDDSDEARAAVRDLLLAERYQVLEANDGLKALNVLRGLPPEVSCLILLDLRMPVMTGFEFLEELRSFERCSRFPVIVVSASAEVANTSRLPCVVGTLAQPFHPDALIELVRQETKAIGRAARARD